MTSRPIRLHRPKARIIRNRRIGGLPMMRALCLLASPLAACQQSGDTIPPRDGPFVLEVRYPTEAPVAVRDSISVWGTVGTGRGTLRINDRPAMIAPNGAFATFVPLPTGPSPVLVLDARLGDSTIRRTLRITRAVTTPTPPRPIQPVRAWFRLRRLPSDTLDPPGQARPIFSRWTPGGALALPLAQGIRLPADATAGDQVRLRLAEGIAVWIPKDDAEPALPPPNESLQVRGLRISANAIAVDLAERPIDRVEVAGSRIRWTLYGATAQADSTDSAEGLIAKATMVDRGDGRVVIDVTLRDQPLGWRSRWQANRLTLETRRRPPVAASLKGLVVALDPGHPPQGSTGPAGLHEPVATLAVALEAAKQLTRLGAKPVLTRSDPRPVSLDQRLLTAEQANAQVFVSIHLNTPGDGRPPESVDGTRVFWLDPAALPLARVLKDSVATSLRQIRIPTIQSNLAVLRATWFPAALVEATALAMPAREALLQSEDGVRRYAAGIIGGLQAWVARDF